MSAPAPAEHSVVVGVDGSESALNAARWAAELAEKWALPLTLLHAVPRLEWHFSTTPAPPLATNSDEIGAAVGLGYSQGLMDWKLLDVLQSQQRRRMDELVAPFLKSYGNSQAGRFRARLGQPEPDTSRRMSGARRSVTAVRTVITGDREHIRGAQPDDHAPPRTRVGPIQSTF